MVVPPGLSHGVGCPCGRRGTGCYVTRPVASSAVTVGLETEPRSRLRAKSSCERNLFEEELGLSESAKEMPGTASENVHPNANLTKSFHSEVVDRKNVILSMSMPKKLNKYPWDLNLRHFLSRRTVILR